ncbi:hypothetical protein P154DRAFT_623605 [Amniculicola lignicola CBS 123094]|uniref:F-box domain-containing protein n=1 Tax=Amniculicola lignicola CBS 123094 TaxID=1392246 RepID=A0A6A5W7C0_9PLEO|nr:hypothetical protein P154DRAFT_623605 [Amniculicola lignicola CBS 123094]
MNPNSNSKYSLSEAQSSSPARFNTPNSNATGVPPRGINPTSLNKVTKRQAVNSKPGTAFLRSRNLRATTKHLERWLETSAQNPDTAEPSKMPSPIDNLPTELLLSIASAVAGDITAHVVDTAGRTGNDKFGDVAKDLCNLALTARKFRPVAQEFLYKAPIIERDLRFIRTLVEAPRLAKQVRQLQVVLYHGPAYKPNVLTRARHPSDFAKAVKVIHQLPLDRPFKKMWMEALNHCRWDAIYGVVLALVPMLDILCITQGNVCPFRGILVRLLGGCYWNAECSKEPSYLWSNTSAVVANHLHKLNRRPLPAPAIAGLNNLKYLKIGANPPFSMRGLRDLPNLKTLDIGWHPSICWSQLRDKSSSPRDFDMLSTLRIDCRGRQIQFRAAEFIHHLEDFIHGCGRLTALHFYAESSSYDHSLDPGNQFHDSMYLAGHDRKDYRNLLHELRPLAKTLETLELPGGFWSLPYRALRFAPFPPDFRMFQYLRKLIVPQAALIQPLRVQLPVNIPNFHGIYRHDYLNEYNDLLNFGDDTIAEAREKYKEQGPPVAPWQVLPRGLEELIVFETNDQILFWVEDILEFKSDFPQMEVMEFYFTTAFVRRVGKSIGEFINSDDWADWWEMVDRGGVLVRYGMDENYEPALHIEY